MVNIDDILYIKHILTLYAVWYNCVCIYTHIHINIHTYNPNTLLRILPVW